MDLDLLLHVLVLHHAMQILNVGLLKNDDLNVWCDLTDRVSSGDPPDLKIF